MTVRPFLRNLTSAILRDTPAFDGASRRTHDNDRAAAEKQTAAKAKTGRDAPRPKIATR